MEEISTSQATANRVAQITRGLAAGDEEAFREFHALYFDRLYQFLLVLARGQEHEAKEALQQTLLRVVRYARAFESEDVFWGWLKVVARSAACDAGRKQQRYGALLESFALRWRHQADNRTTAEEDRLRTVLEETLGELDLEERRLIESKYLEGETIKELAMASGLTDKALESRLLRLRRRLRERLMKKLHDS